MIELGAVARDDLVVVGVVPGLIIGSREQRCRVMVRPGFAGHLGRVRVKYLWAL